MLDYGLFRYASKQEVIDKSIRYWNPGKTKFWQDTGVDLVMGAREGYVIHDVDGRRLIDLHINGGTYNLGHRNPELIDALRTALDYFDIGNHWFPSVARTALAEALVSVSPGLRYAVFAPGGAEAADIALKSARYATKRRKIVSIIKGYHGHSGLAVATGDERFTKIFLSDRPDEFVQVPFNDLAAMEAALAGRDVAGAILETIPATYGFPMPAPGYLEGVRELCRKYGTLYIADEVQTGFMRCGEMWGWQSFGDRARHLHRREGPLGRALSDLGLHAGREGRRLAHRGWRGAHLDDRRRRGGLFRRHQGAADPRAAGDAGERAGGVGVLRRGLRRSDPPARRRHRGAAPARHGDGRGVRPSRGRRGGVARSLRDRRLGDLLVARQARASVQAGGADEPGALRGGARPLRRGDPAHPRADGRARAGLRGMAMTLDPDLRFSDDRSGALLERARWAAGAFAALDREATLRIARAVAEAGHGAAGHYAEWAVRETGFGVVAHKRLKNELCSRQVFETYAGRDFVGPAADAERKIVRIARPAGVVLALAPSTNPVATLFFKTVLAMLTRNAIVLCPHPRAKDCSADAADLLMRAARAAGAPDGVIQVVREPTLPFVERLMNDARVDLVLATGGPAMVAAAYRSGHPAFGVGPGNAPVFVHESADPAEAAKRIVASKSFDNSILCTNESVVLAHEPIADRLVAALRAAKAHVCSPGEVERLRAALWDAGGGFDVEGALGKDAATVARLAGFEPPAGTLVLVAPIERVGPEEPLAREKLAPVLGFARVADAARAAAAARGMMRRGGRGHSAAFHGSDEAALMAFAAATPALRVAVNVPLSQGAAGFGTHLGPTMTVGTGFAGGSALGENLRPEHLVNWAEIAFAAEAVVPAGLATRDPWRSRPVPQEAAPIPFSQGNPPGGPVDGQRAPVPGLDPVVAEAGDDLASLRAEIRQLVLEELRAALKAA